MCGIAGIVAKLRVNPSAVQAMTDRMEHRGPDGEGMWIGEDGRVVLGHRRLAVIDPTEAGRQPMSDSSETAVLTYNGEIYNYIEIMNQLRETGVAFSSDCDTEALLQAYLTWGMECLTELNGMFSFALFDVRAGHLFCARDRFGEKPFLYCETPEFFAFASEFKALFALRGVEPEIDETKLLRFLHQPWQGLDDERETVFPGIKQLLPGEMLVLDVASLKVSVSRYWDLEPDNSLSWQSEADVATQFRELLTDSIRLRMRSDVPLGSCLSGGLDSSAIVCLARQIAGDNAPYHVFTGRFPDTAADEWAYAKEVVTATSSTSHVTEPTAQGLVEDLEDFCWFNELPTGSTSQYAQWCVFRLAAENGVTVLLDGQGADELLGGYEQYFRPYLQALAETDAKITMAEQEAAIRERYPLALEDAAETWKTRLPTGLRWRLAQWSGQGSDLLFGISSDLASEVAVANKRHLDRRFNALSAVLKDECFHSHLPTLLRYGDRNSMAHSREVRLPFCDHRLAELVFSQPPGILMGNTETKHLLRSGLNGILPEKIRTRWNKQGFLPPQDDWLRGALLPLAKEIFDGQAFAKRGIWRVNWWRAALARLESGEDHLAWTVWKPVIAELWRWHFVERVRGMPQVPAVM